MSEYIDMKNINRIKAAGVGSFAIGKTYRMDSGMGGSFTMLFTKRKYFRGRINSFMFEALNPGWENVIVEIPIEKVWNIMTEI
jgi:hypothetical protein